MAWSSFVSLAVEWSPSTGPLDSPVWVSLTDRWVSAETFIGRKPGSDEFDPGTATVVVDNQDREFDPVNSSGSNFGDLVPDKRVRITATLLSTSTTYAVWSGFTDRFVQDRNNGTCSIVCVDATKILGRWPLPDLYESVVEADDPLAWWRRVSETDSTIDDATGHGSAGSLSLLSEPGESLTFGPGQSFACPESDWAVRAPTGGVYGPTWSIEAWCQIPEEAIFGAWAVYSDPYRGVRVLDDLRVWVFAAGVFWETTGQVPAVGPFHLVVRYDDTSNSLDCFINGEDAGLAGPGTATGTQPEGNVRWGNGFSVAGGSIGEVATYLDDLSDARILAHYQAGAVPWDGNDTGERAENVLDLISWPAGLQAIDTGQTSTVLGPAYLDGNVYDYLKRIATSEQGWLFGDRDAAVTLLQRGALLTDSRHAVSQATWSDLAGGIHYETADVVLDDTETVNQADVSFVGGEVTVSTVADTVVSRDYDTELAGQVEALSLGSWVTANGAPAPRVPEVVFAPSANYDALTEVIARRVADRVTVSCQPQNVGARFTDDMWVESVSHRIENGVNKWETVYTVGPAFTADDYWQWGTVSTWGTLTVPAY